MPESVGGASIDENDPLLGHEARVFVAMHATNTPDLLYSVRDP
jgi:hypothetical protein